MTEKGTSSISIEEKMENSYLNYSLSVIIGRALPDVRDGLKPVHRRILYATKELGLTYDKPHKKSARIVGEVLGKYHPHGDAAVYNAMVRMAQDFSQRYRLIDGHGNFGSIDGDNPAAMRYTEARLAKMTEELLADIKSETVDFSDNFDGSLKEPEVLPAKIPNLLVNGSSGIAVGMSTNIPPHNLNNVIDALLLLLKQENTSIESLIKQIQGPDFPTGGQIIGTKGIKKAYQTGKGKLVQRGQTRIENQNSNKRTKIIITEIPYQLNKTKLIEEIVSTVKKDRIKHIHDVRDETDRDGLRVVIELKNKANPEIILNRLYKYTSLQKNFRINMLALVNKEPQVMNLKDILQHFIDFRKNIITRRTEHLLAKAQDKAHILLGLKKATDNLDKIIKIIRSSHSTSKAKRKIQRELTLTKTQAEAILNMRLQRLVGLELEKLEDDLTKTQTKIDSLEKILSSETELKQIIKTELNEVKAEYGDERKTVIIADSAKAKLKKKDLIKDKPAIISLSYQEFIKRCEDKEQLRASKNDFITRVLTGRSHNKLLFFTENDQTKLLKIHDLPEHHSLSTGDPLDNFIKLPYNKRLTGVFLLNEANEQKNIIIATEQGLVKKSKAYEYDSKISTLKAINLGKDDKITAVKDTAGDEHLLLVTKAGYVIQFSETEISTTGRNTKGSKGIKLSENDIVIALETSNTADELLLLTDQGSLIRKSIAEITVQQRNGKGVNLLEYEAEQAIKAFTIKYNEEIMLLTEDEELKRIEPEKLDPQQVKIKDIMKFKAIDN